MSLTEQALSVDSSQVLGPVNERLIAQGKPTISAPQLRAAVSDAIMTSVVRGSFDREVFMSSLVEHTDLTQTDVRHLFGDLERRIGERTDLAMQQLSQTAERAADVTGRAFWGVFALPLVSLIAAMIGTLSGVSQRQRELSVQVIPGSASAPVITPPSGAYSR